MYPIDLTGKNAIVTGAGGTLGKGVAMTLAQAGANVAIIDYAPEAAKEAAEDVAKLGVKTLYYALDVADEAAQEKAFADINEKFGSIEILVTAAGIGGDKGKIDETPMDAVLGVFNTNYFGTVISIRTALKYMLPKQYGRIVTFSSDAGRYGHPTADNYSATKAAIISITQSVGAGYARQGITCNAICPGYVLSGIWRKALKRMNAETGVPEEELWAAITASCATGRDQTPEDMGAMAAFLVSDLSINITGQAVNVCGGYTFN